MEESVLEQISHARLFSQIDLAAIAPELADAELRSLIPGDILLEPARSNNLIYVLLSGELIVSPDLGDVAPLARLRTGECVGEVSMIDDQPPSAYVIAASETRLLAIPQASLWRMMATLPRMAFNMMQILAERFRQNNLVLLESLEMQSRYRDLSETDVLTGLHNRVWCNEVFPKQLELCERIGQPVALAMLDIDHFKQVNDMYGHPEGDTVLRSLARAVQQNLRSTDLSARFGGEEFIILMPATPSPNAMLTMERLRQKMETTPITLGDGRTIKCTVSIGVAAWHRGMRLDELTSFADHALYQAKQQGRNRVVERRRPVATT